jgi:hypothetical protein
MARFKKAGLLCAITAAFCMIAGSAFAGPIWKFGEDDKGLLKLDYKGQFQLKNVDAGDEDSTEFNFRRNRLALMGAYGQNFSLYVQTEYTEDNNDTASGVDYDKFQLLDAVMRFKLNDSANLWVGKFKYSLTRENLEACEMPLTLDRSVLIRAPFVTTRDKGVALWGNLFDNKFQYRVDAMNGSDDSTESNVRYSARAHVSLLDPEKGYGYKGTYLGKKKVLTIGAAYQFEDEVATVGGEAIDYSAWTVDLFAEYPVENVGTFTFSTAYVDYDLNDAYQDSLDPEAGVIGRNGEKNGGYVKVGYMFPNLPLQLFARSENWSFAKLDGVYNQEIDWYGVGFNYYLRGQNLKMTVEYSKTDYDKEDTVEDIDTMTAQLQLIF